MPQEDEQKPTTEFRISGDPSVSITAEEVEAQRKAAEEVQSRKERDGQLVPLDAEDGKLIADNRIEYYRGRGVASANVRAGLNSDIRMPDEESIQAAIDAGDMETAHLMRLQQVQPGTPEFMAKAPPPEEVIEVFGPKGAEGFGVVQRQVGVGPHAGEPLR